MMYIQKQTKEVKHRNKGEQNPQFLLPQKVRQRKLATQQQREKRQVKIL